MPGITSSPGRLTLAGNKLILIGPDTGIQKLRNYASKLLMSVRGEDGKWSEARTIVTETEPSKIARISVPLHSPPNFVPVEQ